jgi:hypothetical protein
MSIWFVPGMPDAVASHSVGVLCNTAPVAESHSMSRPSWHAAITVVLFVEAAS